jgi:peroxiredoxin
MKSAVLFLFAGLLCAAEFDSRTKVGDPMPAVTVTDTAGREFNLEALRGKVVFVNFWATWCGPCIGEMPRLENEVWKKHKASPAFAMIAIAREQTPADITPFARDKGITFPIAADEHREIYKHFADAGIPRSYVVSPDGKILFQSMGYDTAEFDQMLKVLDKALAGVPAGK